MKYAKIKYNKLGRSGDVVFFLHGYGGNKKSLEKIAKSSCMDKVCYLFDLYGFGETNMPTKCYDIYDYAISLYLFCIENQIKNVSIVAHSFGGRLATILSSVFDINVEKLILIDSAGVKPKHNILYYLSVWKYKVLKKIHGKKLDESKYGSSEYKNNNYLMRKSYVKVVNQHLDYLLSSVKAKTLLLWGNDDKDTPLYMARKTNKCIKNSILKIYNGDHFMYLSKHSHIKKDIRLFLN